MKITLVRHGKPTAASNHRVGPAGFAQWVRAYNQSEIDAESRPPEHLRHQVRDSYIVSSDLTRARHSAQLCSGRHSDRVLRELREMDIPRFKLPLTLSIQQWLIVSRLCWFLGLSGNSEPLNLGRIRLKKAVDILAEQSSTTPDITVFGHGLANRWIAKELVRRGWKIQSQTRGFWGTIELLNVSGKTGNV
ncbi:histidine phosphatase family protein [Photobacterium sp. MCCC 1A19761]|uniref:histidine phosphatase family protein n=1 Tax=Photobacterium sp. MCCC 1A19761 TaxID=3115000 RepID=UPI00307DE335